MRITISTRNHRWMVTAIAAVATAVIAVSCAADDEPAPSVATTQTTVGTTQAPTTTQTTVATTQAPATTAPAPGPLVESEGSLVDLFMDDGTTGRDIMARVSQPERDCLREAIGEQLYRAMLDVPMARLVRETGDSGAGSFLGCLTDDNVVLMGLVLIDAHHGRVDARERECQVAVARENPEIIYVRFEVLRPAFEDIDTDALFTSTKDLFDCLSVADQVDVLVRLTTRLDQDDTFTGRDIVGMLSEEEASCIQERVGAELFEVFLDATVTQAFAPAAVSLLDCLSLESKTGLFAAFSASRVEGLREEAGLCMATLVADSPHILALGFGALDTGELAESELAQLGDEAAKLFDCLNAEEVYQVLTLPAVVEQ